MSWIDIPEAKPQPNYLAELNHVNSKLVIPLGITGLVVWLPFLEADVRLFPDFPLIWGLRIGLTVMGLGLILVGRLPIWKPFSYWFMYGFFFYLTLASALIVGFSGGEPVYVSGLALVLFLLTFWPFLRFHSYALLVSSGTVFAILSYQYGVNLSVPQVRYGFYNLGVVVFTNIIGISWFDQWRLSIYENRKQLLRLNEALDKANKLKTEFLGITSHDLKNPLNIIYGNAQVLEMKICQGSTEESDILSHVGRIQRSSEKMLTLIQRFLQHAELEDGTFTLEKSEVDLSQVAQSLVEANALLAEAKSQKLICRIDPQCIIQGDMVCIEEIFDNLISNAIKYTLPRKEIRVYLNREADRIHFRVQDEGPGFTEEDKRMLFQSYQRLSARPTGGEKSGGLGLAIVKKFVDLHQGRIWLESEPGRGSVFHVEWKTVVEEAKQDLS